MDARELAQALLDWGPKQRELDALEATIATAVLKLGKTLKVGDVRATYSAGRKTYDHKAAATTAPRTITLRHERIVVDWKAVCEEAGITDIPFSESQPSVRVKLEASI